MTINWQAVGVFVAAVSALAAFATFYRNFLRPKSAAGRLAYHSIFLHGALSDKLFSRLHELDTRPESFGRLIYDKEICIDEISFKNCNAFALSDVCLSISRRESPWSVNIGHSKSLPNSAYHISVGDEIILKISHIPPAETFSVVITSQWSFPSGVKVASLNGNAVLSESKSRLNR